MSKIRKSAKGEDCTLRIPGICNFNPETVVLCHAPYPGRYGSRKDDWWAAYGCSNCHDAVDGRLKSTLEYTMYWDGAIHETQAKLIDKRLIVLT